MWNYSNYLKWHRNFERLKLKASFLGKFENSELDEKSWDMNYFCFLYVIDDNLGSEASKI